ncbi:hypothetical protein BALH_1235 [Bacillus thuringiensis str. Al Hakam]|nr:hypothetical protein BALH_1235 [Bacillus thuringiensis str. Al Hakam]
MLVKFAVESQKEHFVLLTIEILSFHLSLIIPPFIKICYKYTVNDEKLFMSTTKKGCKFASFNVQYFSSALLLSLLLPLGIRYEMHNLYTQNENDALCSAQVAATFLSF